MLFKPEDLVTESYDPIQEAANILNESVYLDESESLLSPVAIPVVENARIGANVVAFADVERLAEDHGVDYIDAMYGIAEANGIEMDKLAVSVPEWKIIANPEVVNELSNVVVAPISSQNPIYQLCETCIDLALQEDDETYLDYFVNVFNEAKPDPNRPWTWTGKDAVKLDKNDPEADSSGAGSTMNTAAGANASGVAKAEAKIEKQAAKKAYSKGAAKTAENNKKAEEEKGPVSKLLDKVKSSKVYQWTADKISQAIASLKRHYQKLKTWAEGKGEGQDPNKRHIGQKFVGLIVKAIDKLTSILSKKQSEEGKKTA